MEDLSKEIQLLKNRVSELESKNFNAFGRSYTSIGNSNSDFLIKTKGQIKIQWGQKFIDLIKDGKINVDAKFIYKENSVGVKDGIYVIGNDIILKIGDQEINLIGETGNTYVSFQNKQEATPEQKYIALNNIGFIYKNINDIDLQNGIVYVESDQKLYTILNGNISEFTVKFPNPYNKQFVIQKSDQDKGSLLILGKGIENSLAFDSFYIYESDNGVYMDSNGSIYFRLFNNEKVIINEQDTVFNNEVVSQMFKSKGATNNSGFRLYVRDNQSTLEIDNLVVRNSKEEQTFDLYPIKWYYKNNLINSYIINDDNTLTLNLKYKNEFEIGNKLYTYSSIVENGICNQELITLKVINVKDNSIIVETESTVQNINNKEIFLISVDGQTITTLKRNRNNIDLIENDQTSILRIGELDQLQLLNSNDQPIVGYGLYSKQSAFSEAQYIKDYVLSSDDKSSKFASTEWVKENAVKIERILESGTKIATINDIDLYAPPEFTLNISTNYDETNGVHIATINGQKLYAPISKEESGGDINSYWDLTNNFLVNNTGEGVKINGIADVNNYINTQTTYSSKYILKNYTHSIDSPSEGIITTPKEYSKIEMSDSGYIKLGVGSSDTKYSPYINIGNGSVNVLKDIVIYENNKLQIGNVCLCYDKTNNALYIQKQDGTDANFYTTGWLSAFGAKEGTSSEGTSNIVISNIYNENDRVKIATISGTANGTIDLYAPLNSNSGTADSYWTLSNRQLVSNYTIKVNGNSIINGTIECDNNIYIGNSNNTESKYIWLGYRGLLFEGANSDNTYYGALVTHNQYTQKAILARFYESYNAFNKIGIGSNYVSNIFTPSNALEVEGSIYATANITVDNYAKIGTTNYAQIQNGSIELYHDTPFIDFHYNKSTSDYTVRLIADEDKVLHLDSATGAKFRIGNAYLCFDSTNNALYVTGQDGKQINFYSTGWLSAYSALPSITNLTDLQLSGKLTASTIQTDKLMFTDDDYIYKSSNNYLVFNIGCAGFMIGETYFDSAGWLYFNNNSRLVLNNSAINIGDTGAKYDITDIHADGTYVYITINDKQYKLAPV